MRSYNGWTTSPGQAMISRKIQSFSRLPRSHRQLALRTWFLVCLVRLGLWLLPFRKLQSICAFWGRAGNGPKNSGTSVQDIVWAVKLAARNVPQATCLVQAFATQVLLGRNGHAGQVHIGVALDPKLGFRAHAWVESQGEVLVGGWEELDSYARLLVLDGSK